MKQVEIRVTSTEDLAQVDVTIAIEKQKSSDPKVWEPVKEVKYWTGSEEAGRRTILLEDDERLIVSGKSDIQHVYDQKQGAVVAKKIGSDTAVETIRKEDELRKAKIAQEEREHDEAFARRTQSLRDPVPSAPFPTASKPSAPTPNKPHEKK